MHLGDIFHRKLFQKYKMNFGVLLNKTISEWQAQNFHCYKQMNSGEARPVADQIVRDVNAGDLMNSEVIICSILLR